MSDRLTMSVKVRLLKPLDGDWDAHGARLRELASVAHRVLNGTMTRLALAAEHPGLVPAEWKSKINATSEKRAGGKPGAYPMSADALAAANRERVKERACKWCGGNGKEPDAAPDGVKRGKKQPERQAGEPCSKCNGKGTFTMGSTVLVPSAIQAGWARAAERRHATDRIDVLKGARSIASYRSPAPISVTSSGEAFTVSHDGRGYVLSLPLHAGGAVGRVPFAIAPDGRGAHEHMRRMVHGGAKLGDVRVLAPHGNKRGWVAMISYSIQAPKVEPVDGFVASLRIGPTGNVELVTGQRIRTLYEGRSLTRQRAMFAARRSSRSKHQRDIGVGARGHGRARALEHYHAVDDAERRWITSISQELASKAVKHAAARGASWVTLDSSVGTLMPLATVQQALSWRLKRDGFVPPQELPVEGNQDGKGSSV